MYNKPIVFSCANGKYISRLVSHLSKSNPERKIYGLDAKLYEKNKNSKFFHKFFKVPFPNEAEYFKSLKNILNSIGECMLVIGSDEEALKLSDYYKELASSGVKLNLMKKDKLTILQNKFELFNLLDKSNKKKNFLKQFGLIKNKKDLLNFSRKVNYPFQDIILKPILGRGSRDVFLITDKKSCVVDDLRISEKSLESFTEKFFLKEHFLAMIYYHGKSLTIDELADNGKIIQVIPRVWYNGKMKKKIIQKVFYSKNVLELVNLINSKIKLHGLIDIDAKIDDKGNIFLLEVNTRPSGSVFASELAGIPIFSMLERVLDGKKVEKLIFERDIQITL